MIRGINLRKRNHTITLLNRCFVQVLSTMTGAKTWYEKRLRKRKSKGETVDHTSRSGQFAGSEGRDQPFANEPLARRRPHCPHLTNDRPRHSMADHRYHDLADRAVGNHVHAPTGSDKRRVYLFHTGDTGDADLWTFCMRLGLSYRRASGPVCVAVEKNGPHAPAFSVEVIGLCTAHRGALYVCLADRTASPDKT